MRILASCSFALGATASVAQDRWAAAPVAPAPVEVLAASFDADGCVVVLCSRSPGQVYETWEWRASRWTRREPRHSPPARQGAALVQDPVRRTLVLFGGIANSPLPLAETWTWDGADWTLRPQASSPSSRSSMAVAFDGRRGRVVLYGGQDQATNFGDLWEWDGAAWTQRAQPVVNPGERAGGRMAFDAARGVLVLFGGIQTGSFFFSDETWEYDGAQWTLASPASRPPGLRSASLTWDPTVRRVVLTGGTVRGVDNSDLWEWDGAQWLRRPSTRALGSRLDAGLAFDAGLDRVVLFGGGTEATTWSFDRSGGSWVPVGPTAPRMLGSYTVAPMPPDRSLVVGFRETLVWDHTARTFTRVAVAPGHPPVSGVATFDARRRQVVLLTTTIGTAQTWIFDDVLQAWQQRTPTRSPPGRLFGSLAYDYSRDRALLFGGEDNLGVANETWEWDGTDWTRRLPATLPAARSAASLAFDFLAQRLVLFGGVGVNGVALDDVWEWDGNDWVRRIVGSGPSPRGGALFGARADGLLLVGGQDTTGVVLDDVWLLQLGTWQRLAVSGFAVADAAGSVDAARGDATIFSGVTPVIGQPWPVQLNGVWTLGVPRASVTSLGIACGGASPRLQATTPPTIGDSSFALTGRGLPPLGRAVCLLAADASVATLPGGCRTHVAAPLVAFAAAIAADGSATWPLPVPATASLAGLGLYAQAIAAANTTLESTDTLRLVLGR